MKKTTAERTLLAFLFIGVVVFLVWGAVIVAEVLTENKAIDSIRNEIRIKNELNKRYLHDNE